MKNDNINLLLVNLLFLSFTVSSCSLFQKKDDDDILKKVIEKYQHEINKDIYALEAYYYETAYMDGEYIKFTDAKGVLFSLGDDYLIPLNSLVFIPENMRKSNRPPLWKEIVEKSLYYVGLPGREYKSDFSPAYRNLFNSFRRLEIHGPLNYKNLNNYSSDTVSIDYNQINLKITSTRNDRYIGNIYIDPETHQIDSLNFQEWIIFSDMKNTLVRGWLKVQYINHDGKTWPVKMSGGYTHDEIEILTGLTAINTDISYPDFHERDLKHLMVYSTNPIVIYDQNKWHEEDLILEELLNQKLYTFLSNNDSLHNQFEINSGATFYTNIDNGIYYPDTLADYYSNINQKLKKGLMRWVNDSK